MLAKKFWCYFNSCNYVLFTWELNKAYQGEKKTNSREPIFYLYFLHYIKKLITKKLEAETSIFSYPWDRKTFISVWLVSAMIMWSKVKLSCQAKLDFISTEKSYSKK